MRWLHRAIWIVIYAMWFALGLLATTIRVTAAITDFGCDCLAWWRGWHLQRAESRIGRGSPSGKSPITETNEKATINL